MDTRPAEAEQLLSDALTADLFHGPAHNNLGVLMLRSTPPWLYEVAGEFEWARKLMPGNADSRVNLALTLERVGRYDDAMASYRTALEVSPEHVPALQGLSRLQLRNGKPDSGTHHALETIALQGTTNEWREWAQRQLARTATLHPYVVAGTHTSRRRSNRGTNPCPP